MSDETRTHEELRRVFIAEAIESQVRVRDGEPVFAADEVFAYFRAKVAGRPTRKPTAMTRSFRSE